MRGLDALGKLLLMVVVAWIALPTLWQWLGLAMPIIGGLLVFVIVIRVLFGKGVKL